MLRLTLRSGHDGRLLARIIERDGVLFVLDFGDPMVVSDASRRVLHGGFGVSWQGKAEVALPGTPMLLRQLALHYASAGLLAIVDEPSRNPLQPVPLATGLVLPKGGVEVETTEILTARQSEQLRVGPSPLGPDEQPTEESGA